MDNSIAKWLVRAGSLLVVLGFFIPSVAVSCTVMPGAAQTFSMEQLASHQQQPLLYLALLGGLIALAVALIPSHGKYKFLFIAGEALGFGLGVLSILGTLVFLSSQMQQSGLDVNLAAGSFVLFLGYGLGGVGILLEFFQPARPALRPDYGASPGFAPGAPPQAYSPPQPGSGARLELTRGNAPSPVSIQTDDFQIGRGSHNHLILSDRQSSVTHARLRFAQGAWFIQDQDSSNGTFVNGKRIKAQRLNDGDQIRVGEIIYIFRI